MSKQFNKKVKMPKGRDVSKKENELKQCTQNFSA
jgi:hypothetical protein